MSIYSPLYHWMHIKHGTPDWVAFAFMGLLAIAALYCAWVDLEKMIIPNKVTYPLLVLFLIAAPFLWQDWSTHLVTGAVVGILLFLLSSIKIRGQYAMGMGDVKLYAVSALAFGLGILPCIIIATLAGSVAGIFIAIKEGRNAQVPHGPHIALAILVTVGLGIQGVLN